MIEKLEKHFERCSDGVAREYPPHPLEIMRKVNEIIDYLTGGKGDPDPAGEPFRESEDERIRKEIRNFLIDMECKKEWIAYLEKQKGSVSAAKYIEGVAQAFEDGRRKVTEQLGSAVEGKVNQDGFLELSNGEVIDVCPTLKWCALGLHIGDKVRIVVLKEED